MPDTAEIINKFSEIQSRLTAFIPQNLRLELNTWVIRDDIEYPTKKAIPLWSLGMMEH